MPPPKALITSHEIPREKKSLEETIDTGKYLAAPRTLAFVLAVLSSLGAQTPWYCMNIGGIRTRDWKQRAAHRMLGNCATESG